MSGHIVKPNKSVYIHTFGCQMNVHDSARMAEVLAPLGYARAEQPELADLVIINTCSVREKSYEKVLSALGAYGRLKSRRPQMLLAVAGCVAEQVGARLLEASAAVDLVVGPDHLASLPRLVQDARERRVVQTGFVDPDEYRFLRATETAGERSPAQFVTIQKGCDNACAYCIVPSVRGPAVSRPASEILEEVRALAAAGTREVTLIGQNVNAYRGGAGGNDDFLDLLRRVDGVEGLERLRFTTSHPKDFHPELPRCFAELRTLCPWLHLPVQAGSTATLARMDRGYSREEYLDRVGAARAVCPDISLGTDLIVGFPGESEHDFLQTIDLLQQVRFDYAFSFKFSPRPGTRAAELDDDVPEAEKLRRLHHLQAAQDLITRSRLQRFVGSTVAVLVEGPSRKGAPQLCGRSPGNHVVNFSAADGEDAVGAIWPIRIEAAGSHSLSGQRATLNGDTRDAD